MHLQQTLRFFIGHNHSYETILRELEGIFHQIDQDLLQSGLITEEFIWEGLIEGPELHGWVSDSRFEKLGACRDSSDLRGDHLGLGPKHGLDESEDFLWAENGVLMRELSFLEQPQVEDAIHQTQKQVELGDDKFEHSAHLWW